MCCLLLCKEITAHASAVKVSGASKSGVPVKSLVLIYPRLIASYVSPAALRKCTHSCALISLLSSTRIFPAIQASAAT